MESQPNMLLRSIYIGREHIEQHLLETPAASNGGVSGQRASEGGRGSDPMALLRQ